MIRLKQAVAVVTLSLAAAVQATPMSQSIPGGGTLRNDNAGGAGFATVKVTGHNGRAGEYHGSFYPGIFANDAFLRFFCVELGQSGVASANYTASLWDNQDLKRLFDVAFPEKLFGDFWDGGVTNFGVFPNASAAAAFQLAVWELVLDPGDHDVTSGLFHVLAGSPPAITALAQDWIDDLGSSTTWQNWRIVRFSNPTRQDYVTGLFRVAEPGTLALLGVSLVALAVLRRRR